MRGQFSLDIIFWILTIYRMILMRSYTNMYNFMISAKVMCCKMREKLRIFSISILLFAAKGCVYPAIGFFQRKS